MTYRDAMLGAMAAEPSTMACSDCQRSWQRPAGLVETRCPDCLAKRGRAYGPSDGVDAARFQQAMDAIEVAIDALHVGRVNAALAALVQVAPGRAQGRSVVGGSAQGRPDTAQAAAGPSTPAPAPAAETTDTAAEPAEGDDPISLVQGLALGAYRVELKRGRPRDRSRSA